MTQKKTTKTTTSNSSKSTISTGYIMNLLSFIAVCFCGVALFIAMVLGKLGISASFCGLLQKIANILGWLVLCVISYRYIKHRRRIWLWVVWAIAIVMIITGIILA